MSRTRMLAGFVIALAAMSLLAGGYLFFLFRPTATTDNVAVLKETDGYVDVQKGADSGRLYKHFSFDFESAEFSDWFGDGKWTTMSLLSPKAKTVEDYAQLRRAIFAGSGKFRDNGIFPERSNVQSGQGAARFVSVAPTDDMGTAKSMLENNQLWFVKGDELWFRGHFYLSKGIPFTIVDFQERGRYKSPGPRIAIWAQSHIGVELKAHPKPKLRQKVAIVPTEQWFELKVHLSLDDDEGAVQVWQDGKIIIDGRMRTLANANSILNALEVGITATSEATELIVDDVEISHDPL